MIKFRNLKYKNFLSTGDAYTEIQLDEFGSTLVVGQNGAGKSTMLDALSFALFGKAHRNITKNQLVNTINQKDMRVEVEFSIGQSDFKVVRGVKPNVFEIHKNGDMINQSSHNKEYQRILEQNILKLNHKSFHQIVVLGSSSFVPFMQLPANHRREVIEDLLDINVFSKMNNMLKERSSQLKEKTRINLNMLEAVTMKVDTAKKYLKQLREMNAEAKKERISEIEEYGNLIEVERNNISEVDDSVLRDLLEREKKIDKSLNELRKYSDQFKYKQRALKKDVEFYEKNENCPTCDQSISEELKRSKIQNALKSFEEFEEGKKQAASSSDKFNKEIEQIRAEIKKINDALKERETAQFKIQEWQRKITKLQESLSKYDSDSGDVDAAQADVLKYMQEKSELVDEKLELAEQNSYQTIISEMFKDTGIKTKIIKQYIPVINSLVNKYLQILDFYVSFHLDDTFKESIRSRHRDDFSYDSFSEGEKQRIDLALLFTWRQVAKMKNSIATNLLILDETFDSSLDVNGVDNLTKILETLDTSSNVFVISHKGELLDNKFENKIEFGKVKNFSKII